MGCPMHLVLHSGEEQLGGFRIRRVVYTRCVDIQHLLIKTSFRRADVADAIEKLIEIVSLSLARGILQPLIVNGEALCQILVQAADGPLAEVSASMAAHAKTYGQNRFEPIMAKLA